MGLGVKIRDISHLSLVCSYGIVPNMSIDGAPWTLGEFIRQNGGSSSRSKKVWGVLVPIDEEMESTIDWIIFAPKLS